MAFTIVGDAAVISGNCSNSRKAAVFTGGNTDDAYTMDNLAVTETATTAGTITAWVMPGDITSTMSIISFGDANVVEFLEMNIEAGKLAARCTDGTVAQFVAVSDAVNCPAHQWTHVAIRQTGMGGEGIKLFINGRKVASTNSTTTDIFEWFNNLDGVDVGSIGASRKSGDGSYTQEFVGGISDVKVWDTALTDEQILQDATQGGYSTGAIAWWDMDSLVELATGGGTYNLVAVSDVYMTPTYNEFISRVRKFGAVTADVAGFTENQGRMSVLFINAA